MMQVLTLAVVSAGVAVATVTDLEFNLFGAIIAVVWIIPSAINKILWSTLQQQGNWTALGSGTRTHDLGKGEILNVPAATNWAVLRGPKAKEMKIDNWHILMRMRAPKEGSCDPFAPLELPHSLHAFHRVSDADELNMVA
ncbi:hypothetical protein RIF29_19853 [Crotalaria pallida]|uniref:Uncharacterized protein n=1 Tax=Crotalaria pallida TaxID=3830 RepID=A0AAN9I4I0_CROPI